MPKVAADVLMACIYGNKEQRHLSIEKRKLREHKYTGVRPYRDEGESIHEQSGGEHKYIFGQQIMDMTQRSSQGAASASRSRWLS